MKETYMKRFMIPLILLTATAATSCSHSVRQAQDITPGNNHCQKMDWRYGASDIRIQTAKITSTLFDRWYLKAGWDLRCPNKPRIIITEVDNRTDQYISTDMIRDIIEGVAIDDGRFSIVVGDARDERELDCLMGKILNHPKYSNSSRLVPGQAVAPQFLGTIRITKASNSDRFFDYEDYRMTLTLYDIETQEAIDSAWDVLSKKVQGRR